MKATSSWASCLLIGMAVFMFVSTGCAAPQSDRTYVTDYRVMGDRTVKYIYRPSDPSLGGNHYSDQGIALEICSLERVEVEPAGGSDEGDHHGVGDGSESETDETSEGGGEESSRADGESAGDAAMGAMQIVEVDCRETRILKTEEYK